MSKGLAFFFFFFFYLGSVIRPPDVFDPICLLYDFNFLGIRLFDRFRSKPSDNLLQLWKIGLLNFDFFFFSCFSGSF